MNTVVLVQPEIPGNTGAVGRTCVALDMELILIHPLGFTIDDRRVKRSGLDYWPHVRLSEYTSWDAFIAARSPRADQLFLFEEFGARSFYEPDYPEDMSPRKRKQSRQQPSWFEAQDLVVIKARSNEIVELQPELSLFGSLKTIDVSLLS